MIFCAKKNEVRVKRWAHAHSFWWHVEYRKRGDFWWRTYWMHQERGRAHKAAKLLAPRFDDAIAVHEGRFDTAYFEVEA